MKKFTLTIALVLFSVCLWAGTKKLSLGNPPAHNSVPPISPVTCLDGVVRATNKDNMLVAIANWSACSGRSITLEILLKMDDAIFSGVKNNSSSDDALYAYLSQLAKPSKNSNDAECESAIQKATLLIDRDSDAYRDTSKYYAAYAVDMPQKCFVASKNLCSRSKETADPPVLTPSGSGTYDLGGCDPNDESDGNACQIHSQGIIYNLYFSRYAYADPPQPFNFFNSSGQCLKWGNNPDPNAGDPPPDVWVPCANSDRITHVICR